VGEVVVMTDAFCMGWADVDEADRFTAFGSCCASIGLMGVACAGLAPDCEEMRDFETDCEALLLFF
jgi:hypothetical protein